MSYNTRVTRSKGQSDGLSLPVRTRPRRKPTNVENNDGNTVLNTTFNTGSDQHHPQMPVHTSPLRCQSTPHNQDAGCRIRMQKTPVPAVPTASHRPLTPCIPLLKSPNSSSSSSQMSAPLFIEDRYSSSSDDDLEVCDEEITLINR